MVNFGAQCRLLQLKYSAIETVLKVSYIYCCYLRKKVSLLTSYQVLEDKLADPKKWQGFFNYHGKNRQKYFNQLKALALSLNILG